MICIPCFGELVGEPRIPLQTYQERIPPHRVHWGLANRASPHSAPGFKPKIKGISIGNPEMEMNSSAKGERERERGSTLGWEIRQSATEAMVRATGRASPAKPPMVAPTPVGTMSTVVYGRRSWRSFGEDEAKMGKKGRRVLAIGDGNGRMDFVGQ